MLRWLVHLSRPQTRSWTYLHRVPEPPIQCINQACTYLEAVAPLSVDFATSTIHWAALGKVIKGDARLRQSEKMPLAG